MFRFGSEDMDARAGIFSCGGVGKGEEAKHFLGWRGDDDFF
jgi:hypothetical protein